MHKCICICVCACVRKHQIFFNPFFFSFCRGGGGGGKDKVFWREVSFLKVAQF